MGFSLEGVNSTTGFSTRQQVAMAAWRWLSDTITFGPLSVTQGKSATLTANPSSSVGGEFTNFRWDLATARATRAARRPWVTTTSSRDGLTHLDRPDRRAFDPPVRPVRLERLADRLEAGQVVAAHEDVDMGEGGAHATGERLVRRV